MGTVIKIREFAKVERFIAKDSCEEFRAEKGKGTKPFHPSEKVRYVTVSGTFIERKNTRHKTVTADKKRKGNLAAVQEKIERENLFFDSFGVVISKNSALFTLTYGTLVTQLLRDYENVEDVNKQLERMGYNIGVRLIEDFLARTSSGRCNDFKDTAEKIQMGFKMFLGISPNISHWSPAGDEFSLIFDTNPLTEFVELPDNYLQLKYSNILPGVLRGACEMVQMEISSWFVQDQLKGDNFTELRVKFIKRLEDAIPAGED